MANFADTGMWCWNVDSGLFRIAPSLRAIMGRSESEQVDGLAWWVDVVHPRDRDLANRFWRTVRRRTSTPAAAVLRVRSGRGTFRWVKLRGRRMNRESPWAVGVLSDHTEIRRLERRADRAESRTRRETQARSDFLAGMSHELRTPLNAIMAFADVLRSEMLGPLGTPAYREYAADIHAAGTELLGVFAALLDLARLADGSLNVKRVAVDIRATLRTCEADVAPAARSADLAVGARIARDLPLLAGESNRVKQIFDNLLANAVTFTPPGGRITISARKSRDGGIEAMIADTGIGIAAREIPRVLVPFGHVADPLVREQGRGVGLGLPLAKALAERHGGTLTLSSRKGHGTKVTVRFPAACLWGESPQ